MLKRFGPVSMISLLVILVPPVPAEAQEQWCLPGSGKLELRNAGPLHHNLFNFEIRAQVSAGADGTGTMALLEVEGDAQVKLESGELATLTFSPRLAIPFGASEGSCDFEVGNNPEADFDLIEVTVRKVSCVRPPQDLENICALSAK